MAYRIRVTKSICSYCGTTVREERGIPSSFGMKYGRCPKCKKIFRTNKKLYSDMPKEYRDNERKNFFKVIVVAIPLLFGLLVVSILTNWLLVEAITLLLGICTFGYVFLYFK